MHFFLNTLICYFNIIFQSDKLTESAYICEWIDGPKEFKQDLLFFMTRTQFPLQLYASGYFTLSLETFKAVCLKANSNEVLIRSVFQIVKSSWSYFAVLNQVHSKEVVNQQ
jgi:hypothetical protein